MICYQQPTLAGKNLKIVNPNFNPELVKKREEIVNFLSQNKSEIEAGQLVVFFVDESHLLGDNVCGYVWGKTDIRIEIPIKNQKNRQTPEWGLRLSNKRVFCS